MVQMKSKAELEGEGSELKIVIGGLKPVAEL